MIERRPLFDAGLLPQEARTRSTTDGTILSRRRDALPGRSLSANLGGPSLDRIAVVGVVAMRGQTLAVMEDLEGGETRFVPVAGQFKGYRLVAASTRGATLLKNGRSYRVRIGENKPEVAPVPPLTRESLRYLSEEQRILFRNQVPGLSDERRAQLLE